MELEPRTGFPLFGPVAEESSAIYTTEIVDCNGDPVYALNSLELTLYDLISGITLNGRKRQNVLNQNGGVFIDGVFRMEFVKKDNLLVSQEFEWEDHIARFDYESPSPVTGQTIVGRHPIVIRVHNYKNIGRLRTPC